MQARPGRLLVARGLGWEQSPFAPRPYKLYSYMTMGVDSDDGG